MSETILQMSERMWGEPEITPELIARRRKQYADLLELAKNREHEVSEEETEQFKKAREIAENAVRSGKYGLTDIAREYVEKLCEVIKNGDRDTVWMLRGYRLMDKASFDAEFDKMFSMPQEELAAYLTVNIIRNSVEFAELTRES